MVITQMVGIKTYLVTSDGELLIVYNIVRKDSLTKIFELNSAEVSNAKGV